MSEPGKAVFLSYASQDAEAAKKICDALRAAGVEVWFDAEGGLEHGDEWDAKIRKQVKECVLFIAVISANTQAREEGYFRIEWELAAQRALGIASGVAFILPVVIDGTRDADALVPDRFRSVQWTKLPGGAVPAEVLQRFLKLWSHRTGALKHAGVQELEAGRPRPAERGEGTPSPKKSYALAAITVLVLGAVLYVALKPKRGPEETAKPVASAPTAPLSEAQALTRKARALIDDDLMVVRENFRLADEFSRRAVALDATDGEAWATAARVSAVILGANYEMTPERKELAKTQVERAGRLAPDSIETGLALATYLAVNGDPQESERVLRRLIQRAPAEKRLWRYLAFIQMASGRYEDALATLRQPAGLLEEDPQAQSIVADVLARLGRYREEEAVLERVLQRSPTKLAYYTQVVMVAFYRSDLPAASRLLEKIPPQLMQEDSMINSAAEIWLRLGEGDKTLQVLQKSPRDFLEEGFEVRPKGFLTGAALQLLGRPTAALAEWQQALVVVEKRLAGNPNQPLLLYWKAVLQALTGQKAAALETRKLYRELEAKPNAWFDAILLVAVGENEQAIQGLERAWPTARAGVRCEIRGELLYGPWLTAIRADPRMQRLIAEQTATIERDRAGPVAASAKAGDSSFAKASAVAQPMADKSEDASAKAPLADAKSVAVLAFANLSDDKANEYFSDGISEELLTVLQKIPGLHVAARTSAFSFKGRSATAQEIGAKLGVATLVEGSVQKSGNRVKVTARLSRVATGEELWSRSYTRELKDAFALQEELATAIIGELSVQLSGSGSVTSRVKAAVRGGSTNPEAHQLYLQGRFAQAQFSMENLLRAIRCFERATELDPKFALAWAALSRAHAMHVGWSDRMTRAEFDAELAQARQAADRAVSLEPDMPEALVAQFETRFNYDFDWAGGEALMQRALALAPSDPVLLSAASRVAGVYGRGEQAVELLRRAVALDPVNAELRVYLALALVQVRRWQEARDEFARVAALSPDTPWAYAGAGLAYLYEGKFTEALGTVEREGTEFARQLVSAIAFWGLGRKAESEAVLAQMIKVNGDVGAFQIAEIYGFRGDKEQAFAWLERAHRQRDAGFVVFPNDPFFNSLQGDLRWPEFRRKLGLAAGEDPLK